MKIYLAARYGRRVEMQSIAEELRVMGHEVTSRWINGSHELGDVSSNAARGRLASEDWWDLLSAETVLNFTEEPRAKLDNPGRGGRHVELGLALGGDARRVVVVGPRENVFHYLPGIEWYATWTECKGELG